MPDNFSKSSFFSCYHEIFSVGMISSDIPSTLLVIAQSARMLARLAVDAGYAPVVVDCYADADTRLLAVDIAKVASLQLADVQSSLDALRARHGLTHVVYGSGFELCTDTLEYLLRDWVVLGNSAAVFRRLQHKSEFFDRLAALSIAHPETVFAPPIADGAWLVKPLRGEGGIGIRRYRADCEAGIDACCWQRFLPGQSLSALFVAGEGCVEVLGFNRQTTLALDEDRICVFAGVDSHADVSAAHRDAVAGWLRKLVDFYRLRGLGSLDFIVAGGHCYLLEINARIPASAQLYGPDVLAIHIQACLGRRELLKLKPALPAGYRVIYADRDLTIPDTVDWPEWVSDRPDGGAIIGKGQPICSIIADGKSRGQALRQLGLRRNIVENILNTGC